MNKYKYIILVPIATSFTLSIAGSAMGADEKANAMGAANKTIVRNVMAQQQWEYISTPICRNEGISPKDYEIKFHAHLNSFGEKGYELVTLMPYRFAQYGGGNADCFFAVFKRPSTRTK